MSQPDQSITLSGTLIRDEGGFALRVARGELYHLQLHRVPVDLVEKRVQVTGVLVGDHLIEAEGVVSDQLRENVESSE